MKHLIVIMLSLSFSLIANIENLDKYKIYLEKASLDHDWSVLKKQPKFRYYTLKRAFEEFIKNDGKVIVELGTIRSFVDGKYPGCNSNDTRFWNPNDPSKWDWGAGMFSFLAAVTLQEYNPKIYTVDLEADHIYRCKVMTKEFKNLFSYQVTSSERFLSLCPPDSIDLLYMDTGDMFPIEPSAILHLKEARLIVKRNLVPIGGLILIDDVKHPAPINLEKDKTMRGKAKYSIPFFLKHGYELVEDEFQVLLRRIY